MITLPEGTETLLRGGAAVCGALVALLIFSLVIWTARDISARSRDTLVRLGALLLVLLLPLVGLVVYLLLRPRETIAERYERELIEEILTREVSAAAIARSRARDGEPAG
jgi:high-affinity Fe2+/Pb2+ permease